jgi:osmotically-inducible protein OsmY
VVEPDPAQYLVGRVEDALVHDPRVGEQALHVDVVGKRVILSGSVPTEERRRAAAIVAAEVLPGYEVHNRVVVVGADEDPQAERIT